MKKFFLLPGILFFVFACTPAKKQVISDQPKRIILLIGDGMGLTQVYAGLTVNHGQLNLLRAQAIGLSKTNSTDNYITDSGAGATAFATGHKTKNRAISVDTLGNSMETILEIAEKSGFSTGVVVTCAITHATPACFLAHSDLRYDSTKIASDISSTHCEILIGGGFLHFNDTLNGKSILAELEKNYVLVRKIDDVKIQDSSNYVCFAADIHLPSILKGRDTNYLVKSTQLAIEKLDQNKKGSFLMVEGSQIDWGGHANEIDYVTSEVIDFDKAVGKAFDYADKHPGTLVIVTADHETGGLSLTGGSFDEGMTEASFATDSHTGVMVPVYAYGTGAKNFTGIYENTEIYYKMMDFLGMTK